MRTGSWALLALAAGACVVMLAQSGHLWRRFAGGSKRRGGSVYVAWVGEILALVGVLALPAAMMRSATSLNAVYGMFLAWVAVVAVLVWISYRPRVGAWQPVMIGASATLVGAIVGIGIEAAARGPWVDVLMIGIVILLVAAGALGTLIKIARG